MGSGSKGGSNQSLNYYGTVCGEICWGPLDFLTAIILNGNYLWQGNLTLSDDVTDLTGSILDPSKIAAGGYLKFYRGTETQPADPALTGYPPNLGTALLVAKNIFFGEDTGSAPNLQIIGGRLPRISTAIVAAADNIMSDGQVNPIAAFAEILTDERGLGLDPSQLDTASWLAAAHWCAQDAAHQAYTFCSPLLTEQVTLRDLATQLLEPIGGMLRWTPAGKLACIIYEWGVDPGGLPVLDADQWTQKPKLPLGDWTQVPTEVVVGFIDRAYEYQNNSVFVPNPLAAMIRQVDDQQTIDRKHVTRASQAQQHGTEYVRRIGLAPSTGPVSARQPFVQGLLVGDKIKIDTNPTPGGAGLAQLVRIEKIEQDRTDEVTLTVMTDNLLPAVPYVPTWPAPSDVTQVSLPLLYMLAVPLPLAKWGWPLAIGLLATRPAANICGFSVYFGVDDEGDFAELGSQTGFAVRATLEAACAATDTILALTELDGESAPDAGLAANTPGGNTTAAADDTLLALIAQLDGNGRIALDSSGDPIMEFVSIVDRNAGSGLPAATFNYDVLRGRCGTTAQAWGSGASVWIVPWGNIEPWHHELIAGLGGSPALFRLVSFTKRATDESSPVPDCAANVPPDSAPCMAIPGGAIAVEFSVDGATAWHSVQESTDLYRRQRAGTGPWSAPVLIGGTLSSGGLLGSANVSGTLTTPITGGPSDSSSLSLTVTTPATLRSVAFVGNYSSGSALSVLLCRDSTVIGGQFMAAGTGEPINILTSDTPAAGSHTYSVQIVGDPSLSATISGTLQT